MCNQKRGFPLSAPGQAVVFPVGFPRASRLCKHPALLFRSPANLHRFNLDLRSCSICAAMLSGLRTGGSGIQREHRDLALCHPFSRNHRRRRRVWFCPGKHSADQFKSKFGEPRKQNHAALRELITAGRGRDCRGSKLGRPWSTPCALPGRQKLRARREREYCG